MRDLKEYMEYSKWGILYFQMGDLEYTPPNLQLSISVVVFLQLSPLHKSLCNKNVSI